MVGATRQDRNVGKRPVVVVVKQDAGRGVVRDVDVRPAVVVEVGDQDPQAVIATGRGYPRLLGNVRERPVRSEEHTSELQSQSNLVCRLLLEKKKKKMSYL